VSLSNTDFFFDVDNANAIECGRPDAPAGQFDGIADLTFWKYPESKAALL